MPEVESPESRAAECVVVTRDLAPQIIRLRRYQSVVVEVVDLLQRNYRG